MNIMSLPSTTQNLALILSTFLTLEKLIKSLATKVQRKILNKKSNPIKTIHIGKFILQELKKDDKMAYLRYATVYKGIEDPQILEKEIQSMR